MIYEEQFYSDIQYFLGQIPDYTLSKNNSCSKTNEIGTTNEFDDFQGIIKVAFRNLSESLKEKVEFILNAMKEDSDTSHGVLRKIYYLVVSEITEMNQQNEVSVFKIISSVLNGLKSSDYLFQKSLVKIPNLKLDNVYILERFFELLNIEIQAVKFQEYQSFNEEQKKFFLSIEKKIEELQTNIDGYLNKMTWDVINELCVCCDAKDKNKSKQIIRNMVVIRIPGLLGPEWVPSKIDMKLYLLMVANQQAMELGKAIGELDVESFVSPCQPFGHQDQIEWNKLIGCLHDNLESITQNWIKESADSYIRIMNDDIEPYRKKYEATGIVINQNLSQLKQNLAFRVAKCSKVNEWRDKLQEEKEKFLICRTTLLTENIKIIEDKILKLEKELLQDDQNIKELQAEQSEELNKMRIFENEFKKKLTGLDEKSIINNLPVTRNIDYKSKNVFNLVSIDKYIYHLAKVVKEGRKLFPTEQFPLSKPQERLFRFTKALWEGQINGDCLTEYIEQVKISMKLQKSMEVSMQIRETINVLISKLRTLDYSHLRKNMDDVFSQIINLMEDPTSKINILKMEGKVDYIYEQVEFVINNWIMWSQTIQGQRNISWQSYQKSRSGEVEDILIAIEEIPDVEILIKRIKDHLKNVKDFVDLGEDLQKDFISKKKIFESVLILASAQSISSESRREFQELQKKVSGHVLNKGFGVEQVSTSISNLYKGIIHLCKKEAGNSFFCYLGGLNQNEMFELGWEMTFLLSIYDCLKINSFSCKCDQKAEDFHREFLFICGYYAMKGQRSKLVAVTLRGIQACKEVVFQEKGVQGVGIKGKMYFSDQSCDIGTTVGTMAITQRSEEEILGNLVYVLERGKFQTDELFRHIQSEIKTKLGKKLDYKSQGRMREKILLAERIVNSLKLVGIEVFSPLPNWSQLANSRSFQDYLTGICGFLAWGGEVHKKVASIMILGQSSDLYKELSNKNYPPEQVNTILRLLENLGQSMTQIFLMRKSEIAALSSVVSSLEKLQLVLKQDQQISFFGKHTSGNQSQVWLTRTINWQENIENRWIVDFYNALMMFYDAESYKKYVIRRQLREPYSFTEIFDLWKVCLKCIQQPNCPYNTEDKVFYQYGAVKGSLGLDIVYIIVCSKAICTLRGEWSKEKFKKYLSTYVDGVEKQMTDMGYSCASFKKSKGLFETSSGVLNWCYHFLRVLHKGKFGSDKFSTELGQEIEKKLILLKQKGSEEIVKSFFSNTGSEDTQGNYDFLKNEV